MYEILEQNQNLRLFVSFLLTLKHGGEGSLEYDSLLLFLPTIAN